MDSFYPKFGEVELVLVEDNNDFFDPLETNFECEDENEDVKLQLNDNVCEENPFHLNVDGFENDHQSIDFVIDNNTTAEKNDKHVNIVNKQSFSHAVKTECIGDFDDDSNNASDSHFHDDDSDHTIGFATVDIKPNVQELSKSNNFQSNVANENNTEHNDNECIEPIVQLTEPKIEKKTTKLRKKLNKKAKSEIDQQNVAKIDESITTHRTKPEQLTDTVEKKIDRGKRKREGARHYSKRNEIPKQCQKYKNEAYDKKLLICKICNIQFDRSPTFTEHMRDAHSIDKPFECYICNKTYRISSLLAEHIRYHFGEKPYKCNFCDRSFSQLQPYKAHVRKLHTLERPYKCNFVDENNVKCEESFFDTKTYKFHLRAHTNDQPYTCEFCGKKFNHSGTHQAHMRIHTGDRPYMCVMCGKSFAQVSTHKAHMLTHSDEFKYPCEQCDKKFKQAFNLKLHMRVHTRETPYKCEDCERSFAQLVTYRNHRRIHTGEKPFGCTYDGCDRSFRHRNSFRRHLQTHTGEKPFECNVCFKRLSQTSSYISHMKRHEKPEKS